MKPLIKLLILTQIIFFIPSCMMTEDRRADAEINNTEQQDVTVASIKARPDEVEDYIEEKLDLIDTRLEELDQVLDKKSKNLSEDALERSEALREDLVRLKSDFNSNLNDVQHMAQKKFAKAKTEMNKRIERTEDELEQVDEELKEWFEINT